MIIPILFSAMSVHTLLTNVNITLFSVSAWSLPILAGSLIGWWMVYQLTLRCDRSHYLIEIPGTWSTLIIILLIFASKYYFGYELSVDPLLAKDTWLEFFLLAGFRNLYRDYLLAISLLSISILQNAVG